MEYSEDTVATDKNSLILRRRANKVTEEVLNFKSKSKFSCGSAFSPEVTASRSIILSPTNTYWENQS